MKHDLNCMIVQDLLPNYIQKHTSDITNKAVEEHIRICEQCNELLNTMSIEVAGKKSTFKKYLEFLKDIKPRRLIAAVSCILLALVLSCMLYYSEYKFTDDKTVLSAAITEYASHGRHKVEDAYVLETKKVDGVLVAFFKDSKNPDIYGFAKLLKGINMKYRLVNASYRPRTYSAIVDTYRFKTIKGTYYAVGGHNLDKNIAFYGLKLFDYSRSEFTKDMLKFDIKNNQFLDVKKESDLQKSIESFEGDLTLFGHNDIILLDATGIDITESYKIPDITDTWGAGISTAELFMLYVFIAIVMVLGVVFARYFLTK